MSTKNFVSYGDAETLFTGVGNKISGKQAKPTTISYADWLLLTPQQQETGNWLVTGVPGADLSLRVSALETNKQDKTDNNLQTTSKETTGAINELKSGLNGLKNDIVLGLWLPAEGFDPLTQCNGFFCYSVNPDLKIYQDAPNNYSEYATIFGCSGVEYKILMYVDVFGRFAVWSMMDNEWVPYRSV